MRLALAHKCPVCERLKEPPQTLPAKLPGPRDFNDLALFTLGDTHGNIKQFINTVCLGSSYQIVAEVLSKRPDTVLDAFLSSWVS